MQTYMCCVPLYRAYTVTSRICVSMTQLNSADQCCWVMSHRVARPVSDFTYVSHRLKKKPYRRLIGQTLAASKWRHSRLSSILHIQVTQYNVPARHVTKIVVKRFCFNFVCDELHECVIVFGRCTCFAKLPLTFARLNTFKRIFYWTKTRQTFFSSSCDDQLTAGATLHSEVWTNKSFEAACAKLDKLVHITWSRCWRVSESHE